MSAERLLSSGEIAAKVGVTRQTVTAWVRSGVLTPTIVTAGGQYRFRWSEVVEQLRAARQPDGAPPPEPGSGAPQP